jgi:HSP20 family protein
MHMKNIAPWNWGRHDVPVRKEAGTTTALPRLLDFRQGMDRLFDEMWSSMGLTAPGTFSEASALTSFIPSVDVKETDEKIMVTAELPGIDEKDVDVSFAGDVLTIKGEKLEERVEERENTHYTERSYGSFMRSIPMPVEIDSDQVTASFKKGVLTVVLPKTREQASRSRRISVRSE